MSIGRNDYEERREARVDRLEQRAAKAQAESAAASRAAHAIMDHIPPGQPILVGHHSEAHHRRDLAKIDQQMNKSVQASKKADYYASRAASAASNNTISSDDPAALEKLQAKLAALQAQQERDKAMNAHYRKHGTMKGFPDMDDDRAAQIDAELAKQDANPYSSGRHLPVPSYVLSNRNATINSVKKRMEALRRVDEMEHFEVEFDGGQIVTNEDVNRVQILFGDKPDEETRRKLKANGFRWSPREGAWQAPRTLGYLYRAEYLMGVPKSGPYDKKPDDTEPATTEPASAEDDDFSDIDPAAVRAELERRGDNSPFVQRVMEDVERIAAREAAEEAAEDLPAAANGQLLFPQE